MTDKSKKARGDLAAITSFNKGHGLSKVKLGPKAKNTCGLGKTEEKGNRRLLISCTSRVGWKVQELFVCLFVSYTQKDGCYLFRHPRGEAFWSGAGNISCQELRRWTSFFLWVAKRNIDHRLGGYWYIYFLLRGCSMLLVHLLEDN